MLRAVTTSGVDVVLPAIGTPRRPTTGLAADPDWDGDAVEALRAREYARLDDLDQVYLDYTGGGAVRGVAAPRAPATCSARGVFGNPHSTSPASTPSTAPRRVGARAAVLRVPQRLARRVRRRVHGQRERGAPAGRRGLPVRATGSRLLLTADNHNSVNGIREFARARGREVDVPAAARPRTCASTARSVARAARSRCPPAAPSLFAYPAQSNYSGVRHPLDWIDDAQATRLGRAARRRGVRARRTASTCRRWHPDFVAVSWYKVFGYPTGIGSLVVRREALARLRRPWFAGGTIGVASVVVPRHTLGRGPHRVRGRHDRLPRPARHRDRAPPRRVDRARRRSTGGCSALTRRLLARAVGAAPPGRVAGDPPATGRRTTPTAAARSRSTCWTAAATSSASGRSRRPPTSSGSRSARGASATRARARRRAGSRRPTWPACSRSDTRRRIDELRRAAAGQGAGRGPGVGRDRDDRARRRAVRRLPAGVRGRARLNVARGSPTRP